MKKLFCMILALCMIMSGMIFCVSATESDTQSEDSIASVTVGESTRYYTTFEEAITAVNATVGENIITLTLLQDIALNGEKYTISRNNTVVDGGNHTIALTATSTGSFLTITGSDCVVKNMTLDNKVAAYSNGFAHLGTGTSVFENLNVNYLSNATHNGLNAAFYIKGNTDAKLNLTIKGCAANTGKTRFFALEGGTQQVEVTLIDNNFVNPADYGRCADIKGAGSKVIVKNGYYQTNSTAVFRVWGGELIIEDGLFNLKGNGDTILAAEKYDAASGGSVNIKNGVFLSGNQQTTKKGVIYSGPGTVNVTSGIFILTKKLADGYSAIANQDETVLAFADGQMIATLGVAPDTKTGAAVRLKAEPGIRFESAAKGISKSAEVTYGTLVIPKALLGDKALTHAAFDGVEDEALKFADIVAKDGIHYDADGNATIYAAITGIPYAQNEAVLVARAYARVTAGGFTFYVYSETTTERSMQYVATAAKADAETYNRLNAEQKAMLESYINGGAE